jgi:hypothetical protein
VKQSQRQATENTEITEKNRHRISNHDDLHPNLALRGKVNTSEISAEKKLSLPRRGKARVGVVHIPV